MDLWNKLCYFKFSYTTDGSGNNHMKYDRIMPTVWARVQIVGSFYVKRSVVNEGFIAQIRL